MVTNRDRFIDFCKGFLILWVIHIHTVFWSRRMFISEVSLLIDVSLFFFISGYLTKVSHLGSLLRKSFKQFKNLYLEYLVFSCLLLVPLGFFYFLKEQSFPNLPKVIFSMLMVNPIGHLWEYIPGHTNSLWYISVYFSLLAVIPFAVSFFGSRKLRIIILTSLLALFAISSSLGVSYPFLFSETVYLLFYLFIFLLGTAYKIEEQHLPVRYLKLAFLTNMTVCLLLILFIKGGTLQLQTNKFPPTLIYLPFCLVLILLFAIVKQSWNYGTLLRPNSVLQFVEWCGKNTYSIYLMQGVVSSIPIYIVPLLLKIGKPDLLIYLIFLLFNCALSILLAFLWNRSKPFLTNLFTILYGRAKNI